MDEDVRMIQNNWLTKNKVEGKQKKKPRPRTGRDGWEKKTKKKEASLGQADQKANPGRQCSKSSVAFFRTEYEGARIAERHFSFRSHAIVRKME